MTTAWRIERREHDGESWGAWTLLEAEAEITPGGEGGNELVYDDEANLTHGAIYQYRVRPSDNAEAEWLESGEIYFGWAETGTEAGIAISVEGKGIKVSYGGAETGIVVMATGAGGKTIAFSVVIRLPAVVYDTGPIRLHGAVYDPAPIRLEGVKLRGYEH